MHGTHSTLTAQEPDRKIEMSQSLLMKSYTNQNKQNQDESETIQRKYFVLRKLLETQKKADAHNLTNTGMIQRLRPLRNYGTILDKNLPCPELLSLSDMPPTNSTNCKFQLLRPFPHFSPDVMAGVDRGNNGSRKNDQINIFGAMAVSLKAEFLQSCAAAILRRRVSN